MFHMIRMFMRSEGARIGVGGYVPAGPETPPPAPETKTTAAPFAEVLL